MAVSPAERTAAGARKERAREVAARLELAEAGQAVRRELERGEGRGRGRARAKGDVEVEDLEAAVGGEEGRGGVEPGVRRAPEVGEAEGAQLRPAPAEEKVVDDGVEVVGAAALGVAYS